MPDLVRAWRRNRRAAGQRLRRFRKRAGLTQLDLAARSGVSNQTISRIELGHHAPYEGTLKLLATALGVTAAAFVEDRLASNPFIPNHAGATRSPSGTPVREESEEALRQAIGSLRQEH